MTVINDRIASFFGQRRQQIDTKNIMNSDENKVRKLSENE
jgi:hypothetical protein